MIEYEPYTPEHRAELGIEPPNEFALEHAWIFDHEARAIDFPPDSVRETVMGGIGLTWSQSAPPHRYAVIECDNDGDVIVGLSIDDDRDFVPKCWEARLDMQSVFETVVRIRKFMEGIE